MSKRKGTKGQQSSHCLCGSQLTYQDCCEPLHLGSPAPNAEALMRSRYVAYALEKTQYLLATWHPSTRPNAIDLSTESTKWLGLSIIGAKNEYSQRAFVEFVARYKVGGGPAQRMHEVSAFIKEDRWYYVSGTVT